MISSPASICWRRNGAVSQRPANQRPRILIDRELAQNAIRMNEAVREEGMDKLKAITGLENPNRPAAERVAGIKGIVTSLDKSCERL